MENNIETITEETHSNKKPVLEMTDSVAVEINRESDLRVNNLIQRLEDIEIEEGKQCGVYVYKYDVQADNNSIMEDYILEEIKKDPSILDRFPDLGDELIDVRKFVSLDIRAYKTWTEKVVIGEYDENDLRNNLIAWNYAFDKYWDGYTNPNTGVGVLEDYWDKKSWRFKEIIDYILDNRKYDFKIFSDDMSSWSKEGRGTYSGLGLFEETIKSGSEEDCFFTLKYFNYKIWFDRQAILMSRGNYRDSEKFGEDNNIEFNSKRSKFEDTVKKLGPFIQMGMTRLCEEGRLDLVEDIMLGLENSDLSKLAYDTLVKGNFKDEKSRLNFAVSCMNTYGIVPTVEVVSSNQMEYSYLSELYKQIQGEDLDQIMSKLSDVYKSVDFEKYVLNTPELTYREVGIIGKLIETYSKDNEKKISEVKILDLGAGTGRVVLPLAKSGYNVSAIDYEPHHIEKILNKAKNEGLDIPSAVGSWLNLPFPDSDVSTFGNPDVIYCLGRSLLHNNTPEKMIGFFSECERVLNNEGLLLIDIPEISSSEDSENYKDEYREAIDIYGSHLREIGVREQRILNIFDGPDEKHKFNRMALTTEQLRYYADLLGFTIIGEDSLEIKSEGLFNNKYLVLKKKSDFHIEDINVRQFNESLAGIGLYDMPADYNKYIPAWGLTLGLGIINISGNRPDLIPRVREMYKKGLTSDVEINIDSNGSINFEYTHPV